MEKEGVIKTLKIKVIIFIIKQWFYRTKQISNHKTYFLSILENFL